MPFSTKTCRTKKKRRNGCRRSLTTRVIPRTRILNPRSSVAGRGRELAGGAEPGCFPGGVELLVRQPHKLVATHARNLFATRLRRDRAVVADFTQRGEH